MNERFIFASLPIGHAASSEAGAYMAQHELSKTCASITLMVLANQVEVWHALISLHRRALLGEHDFTENGRVRGDKNLIFRLEAVALSTSKAALDCCLGGLYVQALMLTRHLYETWQKIAYTTLNPRTADDWLSKNGRKPTPPGRNRINNFLKTSKYADVAVKVEETFNQLNDFAHPTHGVLTAHDTLVEGRMAIGGAFNRERCADILRAACRIQILILDIHRSYLDPDQEWSDELHGAIEEARDRIPGLGVRIGPARS